MSYFGPPQQEIKFFWPLTEQIPLDLDYNGCEKPKLEVNCSVSATVPWEFYPATTGNITITAANLQLDTQSTVILTKQKPPLYRRLLYKLMGLKWSIK